MLSNRDVKGIGCAAAVDEMSCICGCLMQLVTVIKLNKVEQKER